MQRLSHPLSPAVFLFNPYQVNEHFLRKLEDSGINIKIQVFGTGLSKIPSLLIFTEA